VNGPRSVAAALGRLAAVAVALAVCLGGGLSSPPPAAAAPADDPLAGAPSSVRRAVLGARLLAADGDLAGAAARLRRFRAEHPDRDHPAIHALLGACLARLDSLDAAVTEYRRAVVLRPDDGAAWRDLGYTAYRAGDAATAASALEQAARLGAAGDVAFWRVTAAAAASAGDTMLARTAADSLVAAAPGDPGAWDLAGRVLLACGDLRMAAACWETGAALQAPPVARRVRLGDLYLRLDVPERAAWWYRAALRDSAAAGVYERLALALAAADSDSAAVEVLRRGVAEVPSGRLRLLLGQKLLVAGSRDQAVAVLRQAAADPDTAVAGAARRLLAWAGEETGE